jgi:hypothetical protein
MAGFTKMAALALLPMAVYGAGNAFAPASTNCTEAASKAASWTIKGFTYDSDTKFDWGPGTAGKVSFSIKNSANGYEFQCLQGDGTTGRLANRFMKDGIVWYSCNVFCKGAPEVPVEDDPALQTSFHFDAKSKELSISQAWACKAADKPEA